MYACYGRLWSDLGFSLGHSSQTTRQNTSSRRIVDFLTAKHSRRFVATQSLRHGIDLLGAPTIRWMQHRKANIRQPELRWWLIMSQI
jgi:hypothetical protein